MAISFTPITFKNTIDGGPNLDTNFSRIQTALTGALSRTSSTNNEMGVELDMNSNRIINLAEPTAAADAARLSDVQAAISGASSANLISFTPYDFITSDNVQAALQEVADQVSSNEADAKSRVLYADNETELLALDTSGFVAGQQVSVSGNGTTDLLGGALYRWNGATYDRTGDSIRSVAEFGATYTGDDSAAITASLAELGYAYVPEGQTCTFKNIQLTAGQKILIDGVAKMPDGASDFDRMVYAAGEDNLTIRIKEIDGNYAGQTGSLGTHLVYLTNCEDCDVEIGYAHDHYYPRSFTGAPSPDGIRNDGSGALFFYQCHRSRIFVDRLENWGHEGVYIWSCDRTVAYLGRGQGSATGDEYSGIQFSGDYGQLLYANVDYAGATGIGFDVRYGVAGKLISTRSRFFNGVNLGHAGVPTDYSVIESILVDGCDDNGINIVASTISPRIGAAVVRNAGQYGINQSDNADRAQIDNVFIGTSRVANVRIFDSTLRMSNAEVYSLYPNVLNFLATSGDFTVGETITGGTSGATANVSYYWNSTRKFVQISGITGSFSNGELVTGGTSGATATIDTQNSPVPLSKGGTVVEDFSHVILNATDISTLGFVSISGLTSVTVNNGNVRASSLPIISPSNQAAAQAQLYISSVADGTFTVATGTGAAAGGGAGFRYSLP